MYLPRIAGLLLYKRFVCECCNTRFRPDTIQTRSHFAGLRAPPDNLPKTIVYESIIKYLSVEYLRFKNKSYRVVNFQTLIFRTTIQGAPLIANMANLSVCRNAHDGLAAAAALFGVGRRRLVLPAQLAAAVATGDVRLFLYAHRCADALHRAAIVVRQLPFVAHRIGFALVYAASSRNE